MFLVFAVLVGLIPVIPAVTYVIRYGKDDPVKTVSRLVTGVNGFNLLVGMMAAGFALVWLASPSSVLAADALQEGGVVDQYATLAAAISTGLACVGAGIAVASTGAAAVGATAEKPESFGRSLIFVGLSEGIAIYGLIISFLILP
ncbi:MAG: ATPase [Anaerolineae bacterium]|nr:ATPase [Anaerolineae bacterium]MDK1080757.1 ATPase [Anaerolineae bacterium]MDK1118082.1 ATPase [Anaerolineae bacterium]